jgi:hypothetical protein
MYHFDNNLYWMCKIIGRRYKTLIINKRVLQQTFKLNIVLTLFTIVTELSKKIILFYKRCNNVKECINSQP